MKLTAVWFSYSKDALALRESVGHWRSRKFGESVIFEDMNSPFDAHTRLIVGTTVPTRWPRNHRMAGWPVIRNILESLATAAEMTGATHVVKIDSDTIVEMGDWFDPEAAMCGFGGGLANFPVGACYAIRADVISEILGRITDPTRCLCPITQIPEDWTIATEVAMAFPGGVKVRHRGEPGGLAVWQYARKNGREVESAAAWTFGSRCQIPGCDGEKRERVAVTMATWRKKF